MAKIDKSAAATDANAAATNTADGAATSTTDQTTIATGETGAVVTSTLVGGAVQTEGSAVNGQEAQPNTTSEAAPAETGAVNLSDVDSETAQLFPAGSKELFASLEKVPALWIRSVKPEGFRRCGFGFNAEGYGIALSALTDDQVETLRNERNLIVEPTWMLPEELA